MKLVYIFLLVVVAAPLKAQQPPNFSLTDTEGKEWNLYAELGKGKSVVLDFFFVNCKPCQRYTPMIQSIYESYGADTGDVVFFGISDRDDDAAVKQFEVTYGVTYPSCVTEGGGDTITDLFQLNYQFLSWPTYAVICPDTTIYWDVFKSDSFPALIDSLKACPAPTISVNELTTVDIGVWFNSKNQVISVENSSRLEINQFEIFDAQGRLIKTINQPTIDSLIQISVDEFCTGIYYLQFQLEGQVHIKKCFVHPN